MRPILTIATFLAAFLLFSCDKEDISPRQSESFIKYYTNFPVFQAADVVVTSEGYAVLGTATINDNNKRLCLIRLDGFGNSIDTARLYGPNNENTAYCLKNLADGGFAILGSTRDPNSGKLRAYFIRTDKAGDTLWTKTIRGGSLEAKYFEVNEEENYNLIGYCDTIVNNLDKKKEIWWLTIDSQGRDIRSQRTFGLESNDEGTYLQTLPDGRLVITGFLTRNQLKQPVIITTNENGAFADIATFDTIPNETGSCIRILDEENFLLLGNKTVSGVTHTTLKQVYMSPFSPHRTIWEKTYEAATNEESRCMIRDELSIYILGTSVQTGSNSTITITTTDLDGNVINRSDFGAGSHLTVSSFKRTRDMGFIIAGTNENPEANNTSLILIKTGANTGL